MDDKFYIQDTRNYVGNSMLWWALENAGYTCDIRKAKIFTKDEIQTFFHRNLTHKKVWPKDYIDTKISHHIDMQDVNMQICIAG